VFDLAEADLLEAYYVLGTLTAVPALAVSALPGTVSRLGGITGSHWPGEYPSTVGFNRQFPHMGGGDQVLHTTREPPGVDAREPPTLGSREPPAVGPRDPATVATHEPPAIATREWADVPPTEPGGNTNPDTRRNADGNLLGPLPRSPDKPHAVRLRSGQGGSGLIEAIVAVVEVVPNGNGGNTSDATRIGLSGGVPELVLD
jgi:hypothetical protein